MKKVLFMALAAFMLVALSQSCKKKVSDADVKTAVEAAFKAKGMSTTVDVKDGVATLSGDCKSEACIKDCEAIAKEVKGVKSVTNNCKYTAPASAGVTPGDPKLQEAVKAILKDIPGVSLKGFTTKGAVLEGTVTSAVNMKLKQAMSAAKILLDAAASKLTVK